MVIPNDWFTTAQAGRKLGVTPAYIRLLMRQGRLRHETTPYGRLIDPAAIEQFSVQRVAQQKGAAEVSLTAPGSAVDQLTEGPQNRTAEAHG